jgi:hypothetical protein
MIKLLAALILVFNLNSAFASATYGYTATCSPGLFASCETVIIKRTIEKAKKHCQNHGGNPGPVLKVEYDFISAPKRGDVRGHAFVEISCSYR